MSVSRRFRMAVVGAVLTVSLTLTASAETKSAAMNVSVVVSPKCVMEVAGAGLSSAAATLACSKASTPAVASLQSVDSRQLPVDSQQSTVDSLNQTASGQVLPLASGMTRVVVPTADGAVGSENAPFLVLTLNF